MTFLRTWSRMYKSFRGTKSPRKWAWFDLRENFPLMIHWLRRVCSCDKQSCSEKKIEKLHVRVYITSELKKVICSQTEHWEKMNKDEQKSKFLLKVLRSPETKPKLLKIITKFLMKFFFNNHLLLFIFIYISKFFPMKVDSK